MLDSLKKTTLLLVATFSANAGAQTPSATQDIVISSAGSAVMSTSGNCVYSSWSSSKGPKCQIAKPSYVKWHKLDIVYFGFDKYKLNKKTIAKLRHDYTEMSKQSSELKVSLVGHTDLVGSAEYNMKLSILRADKVKRELVELGIPADSIETVGKGLTDPAVLTKAGVANAKNRRVEMFYNGLAK